MTTIDKPMEKLVQAVDTYLWCLSVNENRKKGRSKVCDDRSALKELREAYDSLELSKYEVVLSEEKK